MRFGWQLLACCLGLWFCFAGTGSAEGEMSADPPLASEPSAGEENPSRPLHVVAQAGFYAALGSPASWGPTLSVDLLPGSLAGRYGVRGEWRGYKELGQGSAIVSLLFEAGASRPQLALKLLASAGMSDDKRPIIGGGVEWSLWAFGPIGVSTLTDLQIIIDGSGTRPALTANLCLHLGR